MRRWVVSVLLASGGMLSLLWVTRPLDRIKVGQLQIKEKNTRFLKTKEKVKGKKWQLVN